MYREHSVLKTANDDWPIWKYMSLSKFINLLNGELYFNRVDSFEDVFEGSWPELNKKYNEYMKEKGEICFDNLDMFAKKMVYVSCFHKSRYETTFMWKQYACDDGIAIKTSFDRLKQAFAVSDEAVYIGDVNYIDYETEYIKYVGNVFQLAMHKRKSFEFENEIRCIVMFNLNDKKGKRQKEYMLRDDHERVDFDKLPMGVKIPIDLSALIDKIYISPYAATYLEEDVELLVKKFNLNVDVVRSNLFSIN